MWTTTIKQINKGSGVGTGSILVELSDGTQVIPFSYTVPATDFPKHWLATQIENTKQNIEKIYAACDALVLGDFDSATIKKEEEDKINATAQPI